MLRNEIITRIKARIDELSPFEEPEELVALAQSEVKPMDSYIEQVLPHAQDVVLGSVPLSLIKNSVVDITSEANGHSTLGLTPVMARMGAVGSDDHEVGVMELPNNFLRLYDVRFDTWTRDVREAYDAQSPQYIVERNVHTRGRNHKPCVIINEGKFEVYSLTFAVDDGVDHCKVFKYIPRAAGFETTFEDSVAEMIAIEAANEVLEIFGRNRAK